jgi:hypothetical protein
MGDETNIPRHTPNETGILKPHEIEAHIVTTLMQYLGEDFGRGVVAS